MKLAPLIIVADRGRLVAYRPTEHGAVERIDSAEFFEGTTKVSEIVTDQSGSFPNTGSIGTSTGESMPMLAELEVRSFRKVREKIREILEREKPESWAFATPSEINGAILDDLESSHQDRLALNLKLDLTNSPPADVLTRFQRALETDAGRP